MCKTTIGSVFLYEINYYADLSTLYNFFQSHMNKMSFQAWSTRSYCHMYVICILLIYKWQVKSLVLLARKIGNNPNLMDMNKKLIIIKKQNVQYFLSVSLLSKTILTLYYIDSFYKGLCRGPYCNKFSICKETKEMTIRTTEVFRWIQNLP